MQNLLPAAVCLTAIFAVAGCIATSGASSHAVPLVRVHAQHDLDCPQKDIRIVQGYGGEFTAIGCGRKASYLTACEGLSCIVNDAGRPVSWRARPDPGRQPDVGPRP